MGRVLAVLGCACFGLMMFPMAAAAETYPFQPTPVDLWGLDHSSYYTWGIDWTVPAGKQILSANLSIENLNDWIVEWDDILYIHLLNDPALGVTTGWDYEGGGDAFAGQGILLTTYTDDDYPSNPPENWNYDLTSAQVDTLQTYAADGRFGFGFDPDCHYNNTGVTLTLITAPEPCTLLLVLPALALVRRGRNRCV